MKKHTAPQRARGGRGERAEQTEPFGRGSGMCRRLADLREGQPSRSAVPTAPMLFLRRVGAHLAVRAPPGTVRAILTAYGSTSETAERHIFQRGQCSISSVSCPQLGLRPLVDEAEVAPIVVATGLSGDNVVDGNFGRVFER